MKEKGGRRRNLFHVCLLVSIIALSTIVDHGQATYIEGIGYREQALQQPKTAAFQSEDVGKIKYASCNGGTNIFIRSPGLNSNPVANQIYFSSPEFNNQMIPAKPLNEDDAFNSNPQRGFIIYRVPALHDLLGVEQAKMDRYLQISFFISIKTTADSGEMLHLQCKVKSNCEIVFKKSYTPVVYYLYPPVLFYESVTQVKFQAKSTRGIIQGLKSDEMPFVNLEIDGSKLDFEYLVDSDTRMGSYSDSLVRGQVGEMPIGYKNDIKMLWEVGYAMVQESEAKHCSYDNKICYIAMNVPAIFNISAKEGYITGGQNLTIYGHGFEGPDIKVTVAGVDCKVTQSSGDQVSCEVQSTKEATPSDKVPQAGGHGLRHRFYNETDVYWISQLKETGYVESLYTSFEVMQDYWNKIGNILTGWFIPPESTRYRFYLTCDDTCEVNFGADTSDPLKVTKIASRSNYIAHRRFFSFRDDAVSEWFDLKKGEKYYIQGKHTEHWGGDHMTVGVEIEQTAIKDHHHAMKEVQYISAFIKDPKLDTTRVTVEDVSKGGTYFLSFQNPHNLEYQVSAEISVTATADQFKKAVEKYYNDVFRAWIEVKLEMQDTDGKATEKSAEATKYVYTIKVLKLIAKNSAASIKAIKKTQSTIKIEAPSTVQLSDAPITGKFRISCPIEGNDKLENPTHTTADLHIHHSIDHVNQELYRACPSTYDKVEIYPAGAFPYQTGLGYYVRFVGINGPQTQMKIISSPDSPLEGRELTYEQNKTLEASTNIFYDAIPFEMLRTYETAPQVIVQVGEYHAVCKNLSCDYKYIEQVGQITSFTYSSDSGELEIQGTDLPEKIEKVNRVEFADSLCVLKEVSSSKITCKLEQDPVCGDHKPKLVSNLGLISTADDLSAESIACTVDSATPTTELNMLGGDNITISGTNLPSKLSSNKVEIKFKNDDSTACIPQASSSKSLTCQTAAFSKAGSDLELSITINEKEVDNSLKFTTLSKVMAGIKLEPNSANPTLKTKITITLDSEFPQIKSKDEFSVNATNITNPSYYRQMNVISVDDKAKTLTTMFGGAWSGQYKVAIRHSKLGLLNNDALDLEVGSKVTSITPQLGSIYGGTLLTITGSNFGKDFTDNPVQVLASGPRGVTHCYLTAIEATQIKCRVGETEQAGGLQGQVVVFLKTSEEAVCQQKDVCTWEYTASVPEVTDLATKWDEDNNCWTVVVTGTGFTGKVETTELMVDGKPQTTMSLTETEAVFKVSDIKGWTLRNMNVYFDVGLPKGYDKVIKGKTLQLTPKLVSVSPNVGSVGGSLLTVKLEGIGPMGQQTKGPFQKSAVSLLNYETGEEICESVTIKKYGEVECVTRSVEMKSGTIIGVKSFESDDKVECKNSDASSCKYEQIDSENYPVVDSIDNSVSNQIVFTGKKFFTSGYKPNSAYGGIQADTVTVDSETQVTAVWKYGLPPNGKEETPQLWFDKQDSRERQYAKISAKIQKSLEVTGSTTGLACSFAGGCSLEVNAAGLAVLLQGAPSWQATYSIQVCEETCHFDQASSDGDKAVCKLPKISTVYSNDKFKIETITEDLKFVKTFGNPLDFHLAFDDKLPTGPSVSSSASECFIGGQFKTDHVGMISQVRYLMPNIQDKSLFVDKLKFQGSADGKSWEDLFAADENIHEGWNYYEWEKSADYPKYRFYRLYNADKSGCIVNEMKLTGVQTVDVSEPTHDCTVVVQKDLKMCEPSLDCTEVVSTLKDKVTYSGEKTALLTSISPRFGTVTGGTSVTFTGTDFSDDKDKYKIIIDGRECKVDSASATEVTCTTDKRPGVIKPSLEIYIDGMGLVANQGKLFRYASVWSDETTWGGEFAPMFNESVYVPAGMNLLVDVDRTPTLNLIMVEGSIIFPPDKDPNHERFFDAHYIFLTDGYMEAGTEEFPYTSKLTITMHGDVNTPFIPVFGNKCIAVRRSTLDMHGVERKPTWTVLDATAEKGSSVITLAEAVDWQVGEQIAIAATSYEGREGEKRTIKSIDNTNSDKPVITLDQPLIYKHFAKIQSFGDEQIDTRAEVGLLTRNVRFRGDPETSAANQYGATIFLSSEGDDSLVARLKYIELTDVGQAFKVGRYAVHFHMIGAVHKSYCKGFGTHQGFNRAFTLHGTHYLRLERNVVFNVKGHNIFIEDAVEKKNYIYQNLVIMAKRSWSLLNTDQTPACFWITNPDNNFIENHCGGSDRYGYWYDLQTHAIAQHASTDVCPENERVGEFKDNHAHSCGRYGLRIFHNMVPRKYPCKPIEYDLDKPDDPWHKNPPITAIFNGLTSWKNGRNGAIAEKVGDVRFQNFKVADNILAGIEFSLTDDYGEDTTRIDNALVIGRTENTEAALDSAEPYGIIGPRTDNFRVDNVRFFNFDWGEAAALSSCSHCFHHAATDSGGRTIRFSKLKFDSTVKRKINYQFPYRAIFYDEDGTLTGKGAGSWATPYYKHHEVPECEHNKDVYGGVFCEPSIQVRRVAFHGMQPAGEFRMQGLFALLYDDDVVKKQDDAAEYAKDLANWGEHTFKEKLDPRNGWVIPFVTNHKYRIQFGKNALDYQKMYIDASEKWEEDDKSVQLVHFFTIKREKIEFKIGGPQGWIMPNNSIADDESKWEFGQNVVYNQTERRETYFIINGKNQSKHPYAEQRLYQEGIQCVGGCVEKIEEKEQEEEARYWDNPKSWPSGKVPTEGEDVHVESGWNMIFNLNPSPIYKLVRVNGKLTFDPDKDTYLKAKHIFIRAGSLHIGSEEKPYEKNARITLYGSKREETIVYDNAVEAGNKLIANVNVMRIFGKKRWNMTRLVEPALKGSTEFTVEKGLDLVAGDRLGLLPTSYDPHTIDDVIVKSYDKDSGKVTIEKELSYYHWGKETSTAEDYDGLDMRGEVLLLTRNVKIDAEDVDKWGGQIVTSDTQEIFGSEVITRKGSTIIDSVEIHNCSQIDTFKAAIRFESASSLWSSVTNCAIHNGYAWALRVKASQNILIKNNIFFKFRPIGMGIVSSKNITIDENVVAGIYERDTLSSAAQNNIADKMGAYAICTYDGPDPSCTNIKLRNNIAAGSIHGGFLTTGHDCGDYKSQFEGNVAHSISIWSGVGLFFREHPSQSECTEFSRFKAYKCSTQGAFTYPVIKRVVMSQMTMVDNKEGVGALINDKASQYDLAKTSILLKDIKVYGEYGSPDCPQEGKGGFCRKYEKYGYISGSGTYQVKDWHMKMFVDFPHHKIMGEGTWGTKVEARGLTFTGFKNKTVEGKRQRIFQLNKDASDHIPVQEFYDTTFKDCEEEALGWLYDPPKKWAVVDDCGNFPCTGPLNTLFSFKDSKFEGIKPSYASDKFQLVPNTPQFTEFVPSCKKQEQMNAWTCNQEKLGILLFESEDADKYDRSMQPIYSSLQETMIRSKINAYMDHVWDGFYTGQVRLSRFPILVYVPKGAVYDVIYTGTPAKKMKYALRSQDKTLGMTVRIAYPSSESRQITKDGEPIEMNKWDDKIQKPQAVKQEFCGEHRYIGIENILEFYITTDCTLQIAPRDAIQTLVRMQWTMDEFFSKGGTTQFVDRVAGSLGIHASTIKIVSVYEGSVVVVYDITPDKDEKDKGEALKKIKAKQTEMYATGKMDLGAPILDVQVKMVSSSDDSSDADENEEPESIIKGGEVTAKGFSSDGAAPLVIGIIAGLLVFGVIIFLGYQYYLKRKAFAPQPREKVYQDDNEIDRKSDTESAATGRKMFNNASENIYPSPAPSEINPRGEKIKIDDASTNNGESNNAPNHQPVGAPVTGQTAGAAMMEEPNGADQQDGQLQVQIVDINQDPNNRRQTHNGVKTEDDFELEFLDQPSGMMNNRKRTEQVMRSDTNNLNFDDVDDKSQTQTVNSQRVLVARNNTVRYNLDGKVCQSVVSEQDHDIDSQTDQEI